MKIVGIIPARGGSKRILKKNARLLTGKPLIKHTFIEAKKSQYINNIFVSTDDEEIANIAKENQIPVINRPKELSQDNTPTLPVIRHVIDTIKEDIDIVVILQPTSPLRIFEDIDHTIKLVLDGADSAETFSLVKERPEYMFNIDEDGNAIPLDKENLNKRRQDLEKKYIENGAVFVIKKDTLEKNTLYGKNHKGFIMPKERSIDIDEEIDFKFAELLMKENGN